LTVYRDRIYPSIKNNVPINPKTCPESTSVFVLILNSNFKRRTEMGGSNAPLSPVESVSGLLAVLDAFQPEQSGHFYDYRGQSLAW
jgi:hypothetical protein